MAAGSPVEGAALAVAQAKLAKLRRELLEPGTGGGGGGKGEGVHKGRPSGSERAVNRQSRHISVVKQPESCRLSAQDLMSTRLVTQGWDLLVSLEFSLTSYA